MAHFRSKKLLEAARDSPCMYCGREGEYAGVVAAHANSVELGKGMGIKVPDYFVAYLCYECHTMVDQSKLSREQKDEMWFQAFFKTIAHWFESGIVKVK